MSVFALHPTDEAYRQLEQKVAANIANLRGPLFVVDTDGLWGIYLDRIKWEHRQHFNCSACRKFIEHYGGLVSITDIGSTVPVIWDMELPTNHLFFNAVSALATAVFRRPVKDVYVNDKDVWGVPKTGDWSHLCGSPQLPMVKSTLKTASQVQAEKREDYRILQHGLGDYSLDVIREAVRVLEADALDRSEKTLGVAKWLLALQEKLEGERHRHHRDNLVWKAVAMAPPGFCHVRSTMISTLLDDLKAGMDYEEVKARWAKKMHPLQYQRPTAELSEGQIKRANEVVGQLESAGALRRRYARLEEVLPYALWQPTIVPTFNEDGSGPFDHLRPKQTPHKLQLPTKTMTWEKFAKDVLPGVLTLELQTPLHLGYFVGLTTAVNPDVPAILQWDGLEGHPRNPFAIFTFIHGSTAGDWSLPAASWVKVNAVCRFSHEWQKAEWFTHHHGGVFLVLEGCKLSRDIPGALFFPETLKTEYHEIRHAMEAYSNKNKLEGREEGTANGYAITKQSGGGMGGVFLRVNGEDLYTIDRWE